MIGRIEERVDLRHGHPLLRLSLLHDLVAVAHFARLQDAEVESRPSAGGQQGGHAGLVHPNADAIAGDTRLRHLEQRAADPIAIADAHGIVGQSFNGEVLAELSADEVGPLQLLLPVSIGFDLVGVDRALLTAVPGQVALTIAVEIQSADLTSATHRLLPDRGVHRATLPCDVAREANVHREESSHVVGGITRTRDRRRPDHPRRRARRQHGRWRTRLPCRPSTDRGRDLPGVVSRDVARGVACTAGSGLTARIRV